MGDTDPIDLINLETDRIPFKRSDMNLDHWVGTFRSWSNETPGWREWYQRVAASRSVSWDELKIGQCINLSLSQMEKNEPLVMVASYFWSDALNAFLFGHGPVTPTLADVDLLTGLDISSPDTPFRLLAATSHRLDTRGIGGWKGFIRCNKRAGSVETREHTAFLMMWLEKHFFCGRAAGPSTNTQALAEVLSAGTPVPLGKHLLGVAYHMLHQIGIKLSKGEPIGNPGGPWWFINLWLNLYMSKITQQRVEHMMFPNIESAEDPTARRRCTSFGEAASAFPGCLYSATKVAEYFRCFYKGFNEDATVWFPYQRDDPIFELPTCFDLTTGQFDEELTDELIKPGI